MNVLAEMQKKVESYEGTEEYSVKWKEFLDFYYQLRNREERRFYSKLTLKQKVAIHPFILSTYKAKNKIGGLTHEIICDRHQDTEQPIIYAVTHVGKFDIEVFTEAIKEHYTLLSGDYEHLQGIIDAPFLALNGVIYFNEKVKEDRRKASERMIEVLQQGGNLLYFPEGTWNLHPSLPMLPCYWGIIDVARKGNAMIVPVAAEQYGKHFKFNIGQFFDVSEYAETIEEKGRAITELRDILATLKYEIWETEKSRRSCLREKEWEYYIEERFKEWPYFSLNYIAGMIYKPKGIVTPDEAFQYLDNLIPCKENAFLIRKKKSRM